MRKYEIKHGMSKTPEYRAWADMIQRCENPKNARYGGYGARGICVCSAWRNDFEQFYSDLGPRPSSGHSIDRIDNNGNYEPGNCRWATRSQQQINRNRHTDPEKLPRGDDHWTRKNPERAASVARRNIVSAHRSGSENARARLTESDVSAIKRRIEAGEADTQIAPAFGVRPGAIWFIRTGRNWRHVA